MSKSCLTLLVSCLALGVPSRGLAEEAKPLAVTPLEESLLGARDLADFLDTVELADDPRMASECRDLVRTISRATARPDLLFTGYLIDSRVPMAHAFPNGGVVASTGLFDIMDRDESAFVIAHEIAHVTLRHGINQARLDLSLQRELGRGSSEARRVQNQYARQEESEADKVGALYATRAGFRFSASLSAITKLESALGGSGEQGSHPGYDFRRERLRATERVLLAALRAFDQGLAALEDAEFTRAIRDFERFVITFPQLPSGRVNLASAHLARARASGGTPDGLAEVLARIEEPGVQLRGADAGEDLSSAREHYAAALPRVGPGILEAHLGLAQVLQRMADFEGALDQAARALTLGPRDPAALLTAGNVLYGMGRFEEALGRYESALSQREGWLPAQKNKARTAEALGRGELACEIWCGLREHVLVAEEARRSVARLCRAGGRSPCAP